MSTRMSGWHESGFARLRERIGEKDPLRSEREAAFGRFTARGFPTLDDEEWRHTSVRPIAEGDFKPVLKAGEEEWSRAVMAVPLLASSVGARLVFVNGHYSKELSTPPAARDGVVVASLADRLRQGDPVLLERLGKAPRPEEDAFDSLNAAFLLDGVFIHLRRGAALEQPIEMVFVGGSAGGDAPVTHPRVLVVAGENSAVALVEKHVTRGTPFTNAVVEIFAEPGSTVRHCKVLLDGGYHVATTAVRQARASTLSTTFVSLGGTLVRNNVYVTFAGEGADCRVNGLSLTGGSEHVDNRTFIDHAAPRCTSHQTYKGVHAGTSRGIFNGKILVRAGSHKTDAHQTNRSLLLAETATADAKPHLEILNDDVKCSHGAAIGKLDAEAVFYLRSRGIGEREARVILTQAFAAEVIEPVAPEALQAQLDDLLRGRIHTLMGEAQ